MLAANSRVVVAPAFAAAPTAQRHGRRHTAGRIAARHDTLIVGIPTGKELAKNTADDNNWKGILIAVAVILVVFGIVAFSVVIFTPDPPNIIVPSLSKTDIFTEGWKLPKILWNNNGCIYQDRTGDVMKLSSPNAAPTILIPASVINQQSVEDFQISKDGRYALLETDRDPVYSHSFNSVYYLYDIEKRSLTKFKHERDVAKFRYVAFGANSQDILYYVGGNLYYKETIDSKAKNLTNDGEHGIYQNGLSDWLYEEEIFEQDVALWWSSSGRYLAYASFDDTHVNDSFLMVYNNRANGRYISPSMEKYKSPKTGQANPVVNVRVFDINQMRGMEFNSPNVQGWKSNIFLSLHWLNDTQILITWSNEDFTQRATQLCNVITRDCVDDVLGDEFREKARYRTMEMQKMDSKVLASQIRGLVFHVLPSDYGRQEFNHLAMLNISEESPSIRFLTEGSLDVSKLLYYDPNDDYVYFTANEMTNFATHHLFKIKADGNGPMLCVSCEFELRNMSSNSTSVYDVITAQQCRYYDAVFGETAEWFAVTCLGPFPPFIATATTTNSWNRVISASMVLDFLVPPPESLRKLQLPSKRIHAFLKDGREIRFKMLLPYSIHLGKRPVIFVVGEPGVRQADLRFRLDITSYVIANLGAVGIYIDQDVPFGRVEYSPRMPGELAIEDLTSVLDYLKRNEDVFDNVDSANAGVMGIYGYAGYTTILATLENQIACGVAIDPVTDWSLYNSVGSARILGPFAQTFTLENRKYKNKFSKLRNSKLKVYHRMSNRKSTIQHSVLLEEAMLLAEMIDDSGTITFIPDANRYSHPGDWIKIESKLFESVTSFMRECLYDVDETRRAQRQLLLSNYSTTRTIVNKDDKTNKLY